MGIGRNCLLNKGLAGEAVEVVAAVDGGEDQEEQAFDEDCAFYADGEAMEALEVIVSRGVRRSCGDFAA